MAAYKGSDVADDEEDAKHIKKAEKTAEQLANRKRKKAAVASAVRRARRPPPPPATTWHTVSSSISVQPRKAYQAMF